jgi:hypothetical protein
MRSRSCLGHLCFFRDAYQGSTLRWVFSYTDPKNYVVFKWTTTMGKTSTTEHRAPRYNRKRVKLPASGPQSYDFHS